MSMAGMGAGGGGLPPGVIGGKLKLKSPIKKPEHNKEASVSKVVSETDLKDAGFLKGMGGAWYYPSGSDPTHVHLIISGALTMKVVRISWKRDGKPQGNLHKCDDGSFRLEARMPGKLKTAIVALGLSAGPGSK
jgi:hypothetical protein